MNTGPTVINTLTNEGTGKMNTSKPNTLTPGNNRRNPMGKNTTAMGKNTNPMGKNTTAMGKNTNRMGKNTRAMGKKTKVMGKKTNKKKKTKNVSLVGNMPNFKNPENNIKISKKGLRKLLKSMFLDMGLEEQEIIKMLKQLGKDEQSIKNLTMLVNKTRKKDTERKAMIIKNMSILKESILKIYNQFDELNDNLGILFERKKKKAI